MTKPPTAKLTELEAVRGIAAVIVCVHHYLLLFAQSLHGRYQPGSFALSRSPLFALVNGSASVTLFFVLSGFVLTHRAFKSKSTQPLLFSALRRYPRLALSVVVVNVVAGALYAGNLFYSQQALAVIDSDLLKSLYPPAISTRPMWDSLSEGLYRTFLFGEAKFNNNLWTMHYEFFGSFVVFGMAALTITRWQFLIPALLAGTLTAFVLHCFNLLIVYLPMVVGCLLAYAHNYLPPIRLPSSVVCVLAAITVVLYGYDGFSHQPVGFYAPLRAIHGVPLAIIAQTIAAVLIILFVLHSAKVRQVLSTNVAVLLGRLSFPLYLTHLVVLCSFSCWLAIKLMPLGAAAHIVLIPASTIAILAMSWPIVWLETWWLRTLRVLISEVPRNNRDADQFRLVEQADRAR